MLTDFRNVFIAEFIKKFATNRLSHCPPHLRRVATLPCEVTVVTAITNKKFRKSVNIYQSYGQKYRGPFLTHSVDTTTFQIV